jgi:hypothetical protein
MDGDLTPPISGEEFFPDPDPDLNSAMGPQIVLTKILIDSGC